jgi:hypothetical protein
MGIFNPFELQKAIYQLLTGDTTLMALVTGIYDRPPQGTTYPYILLGVAQSEDWSTKTTSGSEHELCIRAWSREGGSRQAALIMERVHGVLHGASPAVAGQAVALMRYSGSDMALQNDGVTLLGTMRFRVLLEAAA